MTEIFKAQGNVEETIRIAEELEATLPHIAEALRELVSNGTTTINPAGSIQVLRKYEVTEFESDMKRYYKGEAESFKDAAESYYDMEYVDYDDLTRETTSPRLIVTDVATGKTQTFKQ